VNEEDSIQALLLLNPDEMFVLNPWVQISPVLSSLYFVSMKGNMGLSIISHLLSPLLILKKWESFLLGVWNRERLS
jgi:hypothetical protein